MSPQRVLVIEDDASTRRLLQRLLQGKNYITITATRGDAGLAKAQRHSPDLIILDLALPGINGFEVMKRLHADDKTKAIPVLCITGLHDPSELLKTASLQLEAGQYIRKPWKKDALLRAVAKMLKNRPHSNSCFSLEKAIKLQSPSGSPKTDAFDETYNPHRAVVLEPQSHIHSDSFVTTSQKATHRFNLSTFPCVCG